MKADVRKLKKAFKLGGAKPRVGELVLIGEICRVTNTHRGEPGWKGQVSAVDVLEDCEVCKSGGREECIHERVLYSNPNGGQQVWMRIRR